MRTDIAWWKVLEVGNHWVNFTLKFLLIILFYPCLNFIGVFIRGNKDLLIYIGLDIRNSFLSGLEIDIVEFHYCISITQSLENSHRVIGLRAIIEGITS